MGLALNTIRNLDLNRIGCDLHREGSDRAVGERGEHGASDQVEGGAVAGGR